VSSSGIITTVAGNGTNGYSGDNGPATSAELFDPAGVALDASGDLYIADEVNNRIRMVSSSGIITTVAGNGTGGYSGDNGPATSAELNSPYGVTLDAAGNLYIADLGNQRIRKVSPIGIITTVAGNGASGYSGDNGPAISAELFDPAGVAVDTSGSLYIADLGNQRIRKVSPSGIVTTVAGNGNIGYSGDNAPAASAELDNPTGVALDASGNLYITDEGNQRIRMVSQSGIITTVAGNGIQGYSGDNGPSTGAELNFPAGVGLDASGNLFFADGGGQRIRKVNIGITATLSFANTAVGSESADSPQSFELSNIGNTDLTLSIPSTGSNPSIAPGFSYDASSTCPQLSPSSSASILTSGASCTFAVDFIPAATGTNSGNFVLSDNSLNSASTQIMPLNGTGENVGTTITLNSSLNPSIYGQAVAITATVAPVTVTVAPTGTVQFSVDGTASQSPVNLSGGTATYTTSALNIGTHNITATFTPTAGNGFLASSSTGLSELVTIAGPLVAPVISPAGGSYSSGQMVTLTDAASGAVFYYTTDGSIPTPNSTLYTGPISVSSSETVTAIATATGYPSSPATIASYLITPLAVGSTLEWTWMSGSNSAGTFGQTNTSGQAGVHGTLGIPASGNTPGGRVSPTTWTDSQGNLWLFGGLGYDAAGNQGLLNDVWQFNPSTNLWAWMGGSNTVGSGGGQPGSYGTLGTPSAGNIPGGRYSASVWIDGSGNVWLFGGGGYDASDTYGALSDLWEFSPSANMWTWKGGSNTANQVGVYGTLGTPSVSNNPGGQTSTSTWIDNNGNFWLLGSDFWKFSPSTGQWTWMGGVACQSVGCVSPTNYGTLGIPAAGNFPGSRASSSSWTDSMGNLWLFGGYVGSNGAMVNDTWEFNPSTNLWAWMGGSNGSACGGQGCGMPPTYGTEGIPGNGNNPGARVNATNWVDSGGNLWLFGGNSNYTGGNFGNLNDLWEFNTSTNQWAWMGGNSSLGSNCFIQWGSTTWCGRAGVYGVLGTPSPANIPGGRSSASGSATGASWVDNNGNLWLFGGWAFDINGSSGYLNDFWEFQSPAASLPATASPTFSVATGTYNTPQTVTISDATNGATIYYTTNGTTPNKASNVFSNSLTVSATETLKAVAVAANYKQSAVATAKYTINLAVTPSITWATPGPISYGTPLSATQLDATSSVPGTFLYSPAAGTVLPAGTQTLSVTFTPTDTADYTTASTTTQLDVNKSVPSITWASPASIPYGTALSATQLDASSTVAGSFIYSPAAGTLLSVGSHTIVVTFSPTDTNDYSSATASVVLKVIKATPMITWPTPAPIKFGTALNGTQLDATSPLAGTFVYSPAAGTVLAVGSHTLSVKFTPTDTTDYTTATATVTLTVGQIPTALVLVASSLSTTLGSSITLTATATTSAGTPTGSLTFYDGAAPLGKGTLSGGVANLSTNALPVGLQSVTAVYAGSTNYAATTSNAVSVTVVRATPSFTLSVSSSGRSLGTKFTFTALLSSTVAGKVATGNVSFTVDGSLMATSAVVSNKATYAFIPSAGMHSVTAAYTGDTNYLAAGSNPITITVSKATPTIKLTSSALTIKAGISVTFTTKLSNTVATFPPTGSVRFFDGVTQIGIGVVTGGTATFSSSTLSVGVHTITATYSGDPNYVPLTSNELPETVK
jgi:N-acetylneuraminic acid mutarotase